MAFRRVIWITGLWLIAVLSGAGSAVGSESPRRDCLVEALRLQAVQTQQRPPVLPQVGPFKLREAWAKLQAQGGKTKSKLPEQEFQKTLEAVRTRQAAVLSENAQSAMSQATALLDATFPLMKLEREYDLSSAQATKLRKLYSEVRNDHVTALHQALVERGSPARLHERGGYRSIIFESGKPGEKPATNLDRFVAKNLDPKALEAAKRGDSNSKRSVTTPTYRVRHPLCRPFGSSTSTLRAFSRAKWTEPPSRNPARRNGCKIKDGKD